MSKDAYKSKRGRLSKESNPLLGEIRSLYRCGEYSFPFENSLHATIVLLLLKTTSPLSFLSLYTHFVSRTWDVRYPLF